jgi:hypothetical protein
MGFSAPLGRAASFRCAVGLAIGLLAAVLLLTWGGEPASAAPLVGKDGKIHACYKVKGKAKGTLRVVRSAKVRCPRRWKKVAWMAAGSAAAPAENGAAGQPGATGGTGLPGTTPNVADLEAKVTELQTKVTELLAKVGSLESVLVSVCTQTKSLNEQTKKLGESTAALNTLLDTLIIAFVPVSVPTALTGFSCPPF